jgi:hypothetical protein
MARVYLWRNRPGGLTGTLFYRMWVFQQLPVGDLNDGQP